MSEMRLRRDAYHAQSSWDVLSDRTDNLVSDFY